MTEYKLALILTGHMVDLPARKAPRFPPAMEALAGEAIRRRIAESRDKAQRSVVGIASGARGSDILFLEGCRDLGVPIRMVLPFRAEDFLETSVRGAEGGHWGARFLALWNGSPPAQREVLSCPPGQNPYDYCNRHALALGRKLAEDVELIALWDGSDKDMKPGGTASFVAMVRDAGGAVIHIDAKDLLRRLRQGR